MSEYVQAKIDWFEDKNQLNHIPESGVRICTQIKFDQEGDKIPQWTAEIIITRSISKCISYGKLRYLFEQAPKYLLKESNKFIVFDGPFKVARGEVLADSADENN
ncbi:MAG: hypothetical protein ABRQ25_17175 [Clostridiaceae bacterium]